MEGKASSKLQITIPARVRDALGIRPGDTIRYELEAGSVRLKVVRPDISDVLQARWDKHDLSELNDEVGDDAIAHVLPPAVGLTVSPVVFGQFRGSRESVSSL